MIDNGMSYRWAWKWILDGGYLRIAARGGAGRLGAERSEISAL